MSIYKDFLLISTGLLIGIYLEKSNENNSKIKQNYNEFMYNIKPIIRDIKSNILVFMQNNNLNFEMDDIVVNLKISLDLFKEKLDELNKIEVPEEKLSFMKEEIYVILSSIQESIKIQKEDLDYTETIERIKLKDDNDEKI